MKWLRENSHSLLSPQNLKFLFPKLGGIGGNIFRFNKNFIEILKLPLNLSPLCSQPAVPIFLLSLYCSFLTLLLITTSHANFFAMSLPLFSHAAANPNCEFFNCFDFIDLFTIKKFFNCFAFIVSIFFFFFLSFSCIRYAGTAYILCKLRETIMWYDYIVIIFVKASNWSLSKWVGETICPIQKIGGWGG